MKLFSQAAITAAVTATVAIAPATAENIITFASHYADTELAPFLQNLGSLKQELKRANAQRASWAPYSSDWKKWSPSDAANHNPSFAFAEYTWSARKDRKFKRQHMQGPAADALRTFQEGSQGHVAEFFVTGAKGGNVVQTQPTSDWFQGDEAKFKDAANSGKIAFGKPKRDDTVGKTGVHVSVPIFDNNGKLLGVAIALVVADD